MDSLSKTLSIKILNNSYEIKFPNVGQYMDITVQKHRLSRGEDNYGSIISSVDSTSQYTGLIIDMVATFSVLIPKLKEELLVKSFLDLEMDQMQVLLNIYSETFLPWYNGWLKIITSPKKENTEEVK